MPCEEGISSGWTQQFGPLCMAHWLSCVCRCKFNTDAAVELFGYNYSFATAAGCMAAYLLVTHLLTFIALLVVARKERR